MNWILVGYFPKRRTTRLQWVSPYPDYPEASFPDLAPVEEICSVSNCIAKGPDSRKEDVPFNEFGGYESPASAWRAVPSGLRQCFDLFAYQLAPILFRDGQAEKMALPPLELTSLTDSFVRLGYDAVEIADECYCWGCSPLSCNGATAETAINQFCLVSTESGGMELAHRFSITKPEPGPYCVVEVWREQGFNVI